MGELEVSDSSTDKFFAMGRQQTKDYIGRLLKDLAGSRDKATEGESFDAFEAKWRQLSCAAEMISMTNWKGTSHPDFATTYDNQMQRLNTHPRVDSRWPVFWKIARKELRVQLDMSHNEFCAQLSVDSLQDIGVSTTKILDVQIQCLISRVAASTKNPDVPTIAKKMAMTFNGNAWDQIVADISFRCQLA
eukprot:2307021-Pyramimonas_sp.AAC.1